MTSMGNQVWGTSMFLWILELKYLRSKAAQERRTPGRCREFKGALDSAKRPGVVPTRRDAAFLVNVLKDTHLFSGDAI